jgi:hypothetical protein
MARDPSLGLDTPPHVVELARLGDEIAELSAHLDAATARLLTLIREFDVRKGWGNGFRSCAEWLSWRVGLAPGAARERVRVARALGGLPRLAEALARGELSYSKVRALTRVATPETEARLLTVGKSGTAHHVEQIVWGWRYVDRKSESREAARRHANRGLRVYPDDDGTWVIRGRLDAEVGALFKRALEAAREVLYRRTRQNTPVTNPALEAPSNAQQQADAVALIAETALHHVLDPGAPGERYQVVVHVDADALADAEQPSPEVPLRGQSLLEDGMRVPAGTSLRLGCDASRVVMHHGPNGQVLEIGTKTRTIPPALRRALQQRDRGCRFPGCGVRVAQGHHLQHWAHGGPTTLSNLALLCRRHHRCVHEEGYGVQRGPDGEVRFSRPDGRELPQVPAPASLPEDPENALRSSNRAAGVHIHARTNRVSWLGERLDLGYALEVLRPLSR